MFDRKDPRNRNISRADYTKVRGFLVRIRKDGVIHQKLFSDGLYGGFDRALDAARRFRDVLHKKLFGKIKPSSRRVFSSCKRNKTGIVGVHYREIEDGGVVTKKMFVASWCPVEGGPQRQKHFSVDKLGASKAFARAKRFREDRVAEILKSRTGRQTDIT